MPLPLEIWLLQGLHLLLLGGYLIALKWERIGSALITVGAVVFFIATAGPNAAPFILISLVPVLLYAYCWVGSNWQLQQR